MFELAISILVDNVVVKVMESIDRFILNHGKFKMSTLIKKKKYICKSDRNKLATSSSIIIIKWYIQLIFKVKDRGAVEIEDKNIRNITSITLQLRIQRYI